AAESGLVRVELERCRGLRYRRRNLQSEAGWHHRRPIREGWEAAEGIRQRELTRLPERDQPARRRSGEHARAEADAALDRHTERVFHAPLRKSHTLRKHIVEKPTLSAMKA